MLKKTLLVLAAAALSSQALAHDLSGGERNSAWHLFEAPGRVVVQPGQAALIQVAPQVVYAPAPVPVSADYSQPVDEPVDNRAPPVYYSQPAQTARLK